MTEKNEEREIIKELFISKETVTERLSSLVAACRGLLNIVQDSGEVYLEDSSNINNNEKIFLYLIGSYLAWKSELRKEAGMSTSELAGKLGVPITTVPAPLNKLIGDNLIHKKETGVYIIKFENHKLILDNLIKINKKRIE